MAMRWSHVQIESQPASSAERAASRKPGQSVCWDQSCSPNRIRRLAVGGSFAVVVDRDGVDPEADALLSLEPVPDESFGPVRLVRVVAASHRRDVGLCGRLIRDRLGDAR